MKDTHFLIVGNGRTSSHFQHYFQLLGLSFSVWSRKQSIEDLETAIHRSTHVFLLISDHAIDSFYKKYLEHHNKIVIHFSGATEVNGIYGIHPLMTFHQELYELSFYENIPLITADHFEKETVLPFLRNNVYFIQPCQKSYYHALCVLGGNFSSLLVGKMMNGFESINLPHHLVKLYIKQSIENVLNNPQNFLTGPLARKDDQTIQKNLEALNNDPFKKIYEAFLKIIYPSYYKNKESIQHENSRF